jgi:hypothetical protein
MILQQPHIPIPIQVRFPFPSWATRADEAVAATDADPFAAFRDD